MPFASLDTRSFWSSSARTQWQRIEKVAHRVVCVIVQLYDATAEMETQTLRVSAVARNDNGINKNKPCNTNATTKTKTESDEKTTQEPSTKPEMTRTNKHGDGRHCARRELDDDASERIKEKNEQVQERGLRELGQRLHSQNELERHLTGKIGSSP